MDRKAELERKKARLEEMRAARKNKHMDTSSGTSTPVAVVRDLRTETDEILENLGIPLVDSSNQLKQMMTQQDNNNDNSPQPSHKGDSRSMLSMSKVTQTSIPARDLVQYNKETQTAEVLDNCKDNIDDDSENTPPPSTTPPPHPVPLPVVAPVIEEKPVIREMDEEESKTVMASEGFQGFFCKASNILERALSENVDLFVDYLGLEKEDNDRQLSEGEQLKLDRSFVFDRWTKNRTVTCLDWSTQFPELLCASYNKNEDLPQEPDGIVLVWNLKFKKSSPEFVFHYQSPVTSACYAKFHPNLIIGGTYSGHIVVWDNRSNKKTPVQRTPISAAVHTHPVYCLDVVGSKNAHNLASISTDGKMCVWNLDMLSQPQESIELQQKQSKTAAAMCFSFMNGDSNNFVVGTEEGSVYTACRHGNKTGLLDSFEGHQGPVTGVHSHSTIGAADFSSYFLSSSFDWTVKLWNNKEKAAIHSFEDNSEYIYDARWSPIHPSLFATVDGSGRLDMWNLNFDTEAPAASTQVGSGGVAVNKCRWHQSGVHIAMGDDEGGIHVYDVAETLATPRSDDWSTFGHVLTQLKQDQQEQQQQQAVIA